MKCTSNILIWPAKKWLEITYYKIQLGLKFEFLWRPVKPKTDLKAVFNYQNPVRKIPVLTSLIDRFYDFVLILREFFCLLAVCHSFCSSSIFYFVTRLWICVTRLCAGRLQTRNGNQWSDQTGNFSRLTFVFCWASSTIGWCLHCAWKDQVVKEWTDQWPPYLVCWG